MIYKFHPTCQDLLLIVEHSNFSIYVGKAVQVVNESHFGGRYAYENSHKFNDKKRQKDDRYNKNNNLNDRSQENKCGRDNNGLFAVNLYI